MIALIITALIIVYGAVSLIDAITKAPMIEDDNMEL